MEDSGLWRVTTADLNTLTPYKYVVIFARYRGKWLYCRAESRDTYETAGGHIEPGETAFDAAKRELYEETGAVEFDITPAFDYSVNQSSGQVFLAQIRELGAIPDYETTITDVGLFDTIPDRMRFPQILPVLFERVREFI